MPHPNMTVLLWWFNPTNGTNDIHPESNGTPAGCRCRTCSAVRRGHARPPVTVAARALGSPPPYAPYGRSGLTRQPVAVPVATAARAHNARRSQTTHATGGHRQHTHRCARSSRRSPSPPPIACRTRQLVAAAHAPAGRCRRTSHCFDWDLLGLNSEKEI